MAAMTIAVPYDWLPKVPSTLLDIEDIPTFGNFSPFPWEQLGEAFAKIFQLENVKFTSATGQMRLSEQLYEGLESSLLPLVFDLSPMSGTLCFVMSEQEVNRLMNLILVGTTDTVTQVEPEYREGFYKFLALEMGNIFTKLDYIKGLVPHLVDRQEPLPVENSFCQDIGIEINGLSFLGRVIISEQLRKSLKQHFAERSLTAKIPMELSSKIQTTVHLEAGSVILNRSEWDEIALGDCVLLDHCSLEGNGEKGRVIMTINGRPLFRAKVKDGNLKILESSLFHEVDTPIAPKSLETKASPQPVQEAKLGNTFDEEFSSFEDEFSEFDDLESISPEQPAAPPAPTAPAVEKPEQHSAESKEPVAKEEGKPATSAEAPPAPSGPIAITEIPMTIVVEVARLQISVQKLMQLEAGNLLELNIHPENGVDLVVNGAVIAKGELLKIGDSLGVRILEKA